MTGITERQHRLLTWIAAYHDRHGYAPSILEMKALLGVAANRGITNHLDNMERKGYIRRTPAIARSLRLTERGRAALAETSVARKVLNVG